MAFNVHSVQSTASIASPAVGKKSAQAKGVQGRAEEGDTFTQSPEAVAMKGGAGASSALDKVKRDNAAAVDGMKSAKGGSKADAELHSAIQKALGKSKDAKVDAPDSAKAQAGASAASTAKANTGGSSTLDKVKRDNAEAVDGMKSAKGSSKADDELHAAIQKALGKTKGTSTDDQDPATTPAGAAAATAPKSGAPSGGSSALDKVKRDNAEAVDGLKSAKGSSKADDELHAAIQKALDKSKKVDAYSAAKAATTASTKSTINVLA